MRIAFLMTGYYRGFDITKERLYHWAQSVNADLFFTTWDKDERISDKDKFFRDITPDLFHDAPNKKQVNILSVDNFKKNRVPWIRNPRPDDVTVTDPWAVQHDVGEKNINYWCNRIKDMWWCVNEAWKKFEPHSNNYDLVARIRFDIDLYRWRMLSSIPDGLILPYDCGGQVAVTDHLAYGSVSTMKKYCTFHDHYQDIYDKYNQNPQHPNNILQFYLQNTEPKIGISIDPELDYSIYIT